MIAASSRFDVPSAKSDFTSRSSENDFSRYLKEAAAREIVITRHGKPAGVVIGFESEDDWLEYRLE
jgi:prevent-host-death family protein